MDSDGEEFVVENEEQFWAGMWLFLHVKAQACGIEGGKLADDRTGYTGLDDIMAKPCETYELIDDALRAFLAFTTMHRRGLRDEMKGVEGFG